MLRVVDITEAFDVNPLNFPVGSLESNANIATELEEMMSLE